MLFCIGFLFQFLIAGLDRRHARRRRRCDWQLGNSYFVVAHFHYVIVGGILFAHLRRDSTTGTPRSPGRMLERDARQVALLALRHRLPPHASTSCTSPGCSACRAASTPTSRARLGHLEPDRRHRRRASRRSRSSSSSGTCIRSRVKDAGRQRSVGRVDARVVDDLAAARVQLRDAPGGEEPPPAVGPEASRRSRLEVRVARRATVKLVTASPRRRRRGELPSRGQGRHVRPHRRRVGDLHHLRRRVRLLHRQEPSAARRPQILRRRRSSSRLPALEQPDDRARAARASSGAARARSPRWWLATFVLGAIFLAGTGTGVAPPHRRRRPDHQHESLRHHVLLARRPARLPRHVGLVLIGRGRSSSRSAARVGQRSTSTSSRCSRSTGTSSTRSGSSSSPSSTSWGADDGHERFSRDDRSRDHRGPRADRMAASSCAFGVTLIFAGLVTSALMSVLGAVLTLAGAVGWFRQVLPAAGARASCPVTAEVVRSRPAGPAIEQVPHAAAGTGPRRRCRSRSIRSRRASRAASPAASRWRSSPCSTASSSGHGIWYPINLLAAGPAFRPMTSAAARRHSTWPPSSSRSSIHAVDLAARRRALRRDAADAAAAADPPRRPHRAARSGRACSTSALALINPVLAERIDWLWFVVSQVGFGIVAGLVVSRRERDRHDAAAAARRARRRRGDRARRRFADEGEDHE